MYQIANIVAITVVDRSKEEVLRKRKLVVEVVCRLKDLLSQSHTWDAR
jgi:hypothetical protein